MLDLSAEADPCRHCDGTGKAPCPECRGLGTYWSGKELRHCGTCKEYSGSLPCEECDRTGLVRGREFGA